MNPKEKLIIKFLRKNGRSSTTRIAAEIKADIWIAKKYLVNLEEKGKIRCESETNATYWELDK